MRSTHIRRSALDTLSRLGGDEGTEVPVTFRTLNEATIGSPRDVTGAPRAAKRPPMSARVDFKDVRLGKKQSS